MINVSIYKQSNFPVSSQKIKDVIKKTLKENGIVSDAVVDVAIVNDAKIEEINTKYYKDKVYKHPIFTFTNMDDAPAKTGFVFPPDGKLYLGQIVLSYPYILEEAKEKNKLLDEVAVELAEHGAIHLVGVHHEP